MKTRILSMGAALLLCCAAASAQNPMTCFGSVALGRYQQLDARAALEGRTVKVWAFTSAGMTGTVGGDSMYEKEPIVRKFSATSVTESQGGEQASDDITYEGKAWCRKDAYDGQKKCFGIVIQRGTANGDEYREVEMKNDGGFCQAYIIAKLEGVTPSAAEASQQAPTGGARRAPRQ